MSTTFWYVLIILCAVVCPVFAESQEDETLSVTRDKEKTVYTTGGTNQGEDPDKEKAWEMLKDMNIWTRERDGKGPNTGR